VDKDYTFLYVDNFERAPMVCEGNIYSLMAAITNANNGYSKMKVVFDAKDSEEIVTRDIWIKVSSILGFQKVIDE